LPPRLRAALHADVQHERLTAADVLASLTSLRRQTAVDATRDIPEDGSLRTLRVVRRDTLLIAPLRFAAAPHNNDLALLAACALGVRRGGLGRTRGRGRLLLRLHASEPAATSAAYADETFTREQFTRFVAQVQPT
jgi:hypothetical protein